MYGKTGEQCHFFGKKQSSEHIAKRSGKNHCKSKPVINIQTNEIFDTIGLAAKSAGMTASMMQYRIKSNKGDFKLHKNDNIDIQNGKVIVC